MTEPEPTGDDFLRDLARDAAERRDHNVRQIVQRTETAPTATHVGRRAVVDRLRAEWHALNTDPTTNETE